jgi:hypothetical protein
MDARVYSRDEVQAILARAIERQAGDGLTHIELLAVAREAGIAPELVANAARELVAQREEDARRARAYAAARAALTRAFANHAFSYLVVIGFLLAVNVLTSTAYLWFVWPALAWGVAIAFHARAAFAPSDEAMARVARAISLRAAREEKKLVRVAAEPSATVARAVATDEAAADEAAAEAEAEADAHAAAAPRARPMQR